MKNKEVQEEKSVAPIKIIELDFKHKETFEIAMDVYSLTIAQNMTNSSPYLFYYCIKQCMFCLMLQFGSVYWFVHDDWNLDHFDSFIVSTSCLRLAMAIVL